MRSSIRRASWFLLVAALMLGAAGESRAIVTDFSIDHRPIRLGERIICTAEFGDPSATIDTVNWYFYAVSADGTQAGPSRMALSTTTVFSFDAAYVGNVNVVIHVTYKPQPMGAPPAPPWSLITHTIAVLPPDQDVVIAGLNVPTSASDMFLLPAVDTVKFELRAQGQAIGGQFSGYAQEQLTHKRLWTITSLGVMGWTTPADGGVTPQPGDDNTAFQQMGNLIVDQKTYPFPSDLWAQIPVGHDLFLFTQTNRLQVQDWFGVWQTFLFPPHYFRRQKANGSDWILLEDNSPWE